MQLPHGCWHQGTGGCRFPWAWGAPCWLVGCRAVPVSCGCLGAAPSSDLAPGHTCLHFQGVEVVFFLLFLACTQKREEPSAGGIRSVLWGRVPGPPQGRREPTWDPRAQLGAGFGPRKGTHCCRVRPGPCSPGDAGCRDVSWLLPRPLPAPWLGGSGGAAPAGARAGRGSARSPAGFLCYRHISHAAGMRRAAARKVDKNNTDRFWGCKPLQTLSCWGRGQSRGSRARAWCVPAGTCGGTHPPVPRHGHRWGR